MRPFALAVELGMLFLGIPTLLYALGAHVVGWIIPALIVTALYCAWLIRRDKHFNRRKLYAIAPVRRHLPGILLRALLGVCAISTVVLIYIPDQFLSFPRERPDIWLVVMCAYPLLSVYPQEFIYRAFFFHRYAPLLQHRSLALILGSGAAFSYAHIVFHNWQAPLLTLAGGWLFAYTYHRSRSILCACIEHAIWGNMIFTLGLGRYFYGGAVAATLAAGSGG